MQFNAVEYSLTQRFSGASVAVLVVNTTNTGYRAASSPVSCRVSMGALKRSSRICDEHAALTVRHCRDSDVTGRSSMIFCLALADATIADPLTITALES